MSRSSAALPRLAAIDAGGFVYVANEDPSPLIVIDPDTGDGCQPERGRAEMPRESNAERLSERSRRLCLAAR